MCEAENRKNSVTSRRRIREAMRMRSKRIDNVGKKHSIRHDDRFRNSRHRKRIVYGRLRNSSVREEVATVRRACGVGKTTTGRYRLSSSLSCIRRFERASEDDDDVCTARDVAETAWAARVQVP